MDLSLLKTLKHKLATAKNFSEIQTYFLDHFGENPEFMSLGEATTHPLIEAALEAALAQIMGGKPTPPTSMRLVRLPEEKFIHGGFFVKGLPGNVIYFEDVHQGLASLVWSLKPPETKYFRFSAQPMPVGQAGRPRPSRN